MMADRKPQSAPNGWTNTVLRAVLLPLCLVAAPGWPGESASTVNLYVATRGDDTWSGTKPAPTPDGRDGPFATLERARDRLRELRKAGPLTRGATVHVRGGMYYLAHTFELAGEDSGTAEGPIVYRAYREERPVLFGGVAVTGFRPYQGSILRADVTALGLDAIRPLRGPRVSGNAPGFELFFKGERMPLSRWPNRIPGHPRWGDWALIPKTTENTRLHFHYGGDRPGTWSRPELAQVHLFPWYNYMDQYIGVKSIDAADKIIYVDGRTQYNVQPGRRYYVRNVFEELDAPGEWYHDRDKGHLYFWPPAPLGGAPVVASRLDTIVQLAGASHVTVRGFTIEACTRVAVVISGGSNCTLGGCEVRNALGSGVSVSGTNHAVLGNDVHHVGQSGIVVRGGDRKTLTPGRNRAVNNHVHHVSCMLHTYSSALRLDGCGNLAQNNLLHDGPHMLAGMAGNDHVFEYNDVHHGMQITSHGGVFYCGRDLTQRGNVIRYNAFHDIYGYGFDHADKARGVFVYSSPVRRLPGAFGIHLDDQMSGYHIHGNLFYRFGHGVIRLGGGRDTVIENNVFFDAGWAVHVDNRGMGWQKRSISHGTLGKRLRGIDYGKPPWSAKYPELVDILDDRLGEPVDNIVRRNIFRQTSVLYSFRRVPADRFTCDQNLVWRGGEPIEVNAQTYGPSRGGRVPFEEWRKIGFDAQSLLADPRFVDPANDDYRVRPDSPAWSLGFKPIPADKIGLFIDEFRPGPLPQPDSRTPAREDVTEEYPIPEWVAPQAEAVTVVQTAAEVTVDGVLTPAEWNGADGKTALPMKADYRDLAVKHPSLAWVRHNGTDLLVGVRNTIGPRTPATQGSTWGRDDAVEVALQYVDKGKAGPILVFRGFACGKWVCLQQAGARAALVAKPKRAIQYAARMSGRGRWDAEWRIPLLDIGVRPPQPAGDRVLRFNVTARKASTREWAMWQPTGGNSYRVGNAGIVRLTLPDGG